MGGNRRHRVLSVRGATICQYGARRRLTRLRRGRRRSTYGLVPRSHRSSKRRHRRPHRTTVSHAEHKVIPVHGHHLDATALRARLTTELRPRTISRPRHARPDVQAAIVLHHESLTRITGRQLRQIRIGGNRPRQIHTMTRRPLHTRSHQHTTTTRGSRTHRRGTRRRHPHSPTQASHDAAPPHGTTKTPCWECPAGAS